MQIAMIGCPFSTTYGHYIASLRDEFERAGARMEWIASNCGCHDPAEMRRDFVTKDCKYFDLPNWVGDYSVVVYSPQRVNRAIKSPFRNASLWLRASRYAQLSQGANVVHLQQTMNSYGFDIARRLLNRDDMGTTARIVTLHELDDEQVHKVEGNHAYNLADAIIVHDTNLKKQLVEYGVKGDLIHVVCCGTDLDDVEDESVRDGIVFYGGHRLNNSKGIDVLLSSYAMLKDSMETLPRLRIHGHYGATPPAVREQAQRLGIDDHVDWLGDISFDEIKKLYRRSQVCVLPFRGSFSGMPAAIAAANRLPIIGTRRSGLPEHIGDLGIYVDLEPAELAKRIAEVLRNEEYRKAQGAKLRAHAERNLGWGNIVRQTLDIYRSACQRAGERMAEKVSA